MASKSVYQIILELDGDQRTKQALEDVGKAAGLSGAALLAVSVAAGKSAAEYGASLDLVDTLLDETTVNVDQFSDSLFDLNADTRGLVNVQEGAVASYDMLSAGIKDQTALTVSLEQAQKAAIVGQSDLNTISKAATSVVNSYGDALGTGLTQAEKFDKVINLMVQTQADGVITGAEYAAGIGNIASMANGAGVSIEELNAAIALSTVKGTPASQAMTRLTALISNIQKPTAEAAKEAERLGISFDASALKSKGLVGLMQELATNGALTDDSFSKLFGSTEALGIAQQLVSNNGADLDAMLQKQLNSTGALDDAFAKVSDGEIVKLTASLNLLNAGFIKLGQGVLVAVEPMIATIGELAIKLGEFSNTPVGTEFIKFLGVALVGVGTVLTVAGAITLLSTSIGTINTTIALTSTFVNSKLIPSLAKLVLGANSGAVSMGALRASLLALQSAVPVLLALAAAVAAVTLAVKQYQNIEAELDNLELQGLQQETQKLADKATSLGLRIQETGKAIPQAEFDAWIKTLEDANKGNGQLTQVIDALKRKQEAAKASTDKETGATKDNTKSKEDQAEALEKAQEAYQKYESQIRSTIANVQSEANNQVAAIELTDGSEEQKIQQTLDIKESAIDQEIQLLEQLAAKEGATKEQRIAVENEITAKSLEISKARKDALEQLENLRTENLRAQLDTRKALIDQEFASTGNLEKYIKDSTALINDRYNIESKLIDEKLSKVVKGSAEESKLILDKTNLEVAKTQQLIELDKKRIADKIEGITVEIDYRKQLSDLMAQDLNIETALLDTKAKYYDSIASNADKISGLLEKDNLTQEQTNTLLELGSQLTGQKLTSENAQLLLTEAINQAEIRKLEIKKQQIAIEIEQLRIASEIRQLELDAEKQTIQTQLEDKTLTANQRKGLENQLKTIDSKKELETKLTSAKVDSLNLELGLTDFAIALEKVTQSIEANPPVEPVDNGDRKIQSDGLPEAPRYRGSQRINQSTNTPLPTIPTFENRPTTNTGVEVLVPHLEAIKNNSSNILGEVTNIGKSINNMQAGLQGIQNSLNNLRPTPTRR